MEPSQVYLIPEILGHSPDSNANFCCPRAWQFPDATALQPPGMSLNCLQLWGKAAGKQLIMGAARETPEDELLAAALDKSNKTSAAELVECHKSSSLTYMQDFAVLHDIVLAGKQLEAVHACVKLPAAHTCCALHGCAALPCPAAVVADGGEATGGCARGATAAARALQGPGRGAAEG